MSNQLASPGGRSVAAAGVTPTGTIQLHTLSLDTAQLSQHSTILGAQLLRKDGSPIQISNLVLAAGSAGLAGGPHSSSQPPSQPLISLAAADGSAFLTKGSEVLWQREEALAEVSSVLFLDLPADAQSAEKVDTTHEQTSIMDHIQSQFLSLKVAILCCAVLWAVLCCGCAVLCPLLVELSDRSALCCFLSQLLRGAMLCCAVPCHASAMSCSAAGCHAAPCPAMS